MKLRIVKVEYCVTEGGLIPIKMIHEFEGNDCCLISKFRDKYGTIKIGIRNNPNEKPFKEWKLIKTLHKDSPFKDDNNELEEILIYVVEDIE